MNELDDYICGKFDRSNPSSPYYEGEYCDHCMEWSIEIDIDGNCPRCRLIECPECGNKYRVSDLECPECKPFNLI